MLRSLIRFSIDHAAVVLTLGGLLLGLAVWRLPHAPVDVFPELKSPRVVILTEAPGLATDEVEQYVTFPIESVINGTPSVRRVRSSSAIGLSIVFVDFDWGMDIYLARQLVAERLDLVRDDLPESAHAAMGPITSITGEFMLLALSSPDGSVSELELRSYGEFELRNKLLAVPGVSQVSVIGGELPEYQVLVDQEKLRLYGLTVGDVAEAAGAAHTTRSAGYLPHVDGLEVPIRQSGRVRSVEDVAGTVLRMHEGTPVTIGEVAEVRLGPALKRGTGADGGRPAVVLTLHKAAGTNTLQVTEGVDALLDSVEPALPAGIAINRNVFRQSDFIERAVHNVTTALRDAAIIVAIILALFLLNLRTLLVTLTALPLSLAAGLLVLDWIGESINAMTLGGLAIAVGSLVDDAIIDVENVFRRLKQNARRPPQERLPKRRVVFDASNEIRPAMVFATVIIALVFAPLMFLQGVEGRFFRPLGIAFVVSLLASLLVALTVTPAMCALLLRGGDSAAARRDGFLVRVLKRGYAPLLRWALRWRGAILGGAAALTVATLWLGSTYGTSFLPEFNEGTFTVGLYAPPGTSLQTSDRLAAAVEQRFLEIDGVRSVTRRTGRAERDEHAEPVSSSEIDVTVEPGHPRLEVRRAITRVLEQVPGITTNVGQPIEHRLSHVLSGTPAAIAINVYGNDLAGLRAVAQRIEQTLRGMPGTRDVAANRELRIRSLPVDFRQEDLQAYGLTPQAAASQVSTAMYGEVVAEINEGVRRYDLVVRLQDEGRDEVADLESLVLRGMGGALARLEEVADVGPELAPFQITRENAQRKAVVSLNVAGDANLGHLVERVRERVDPIVRDAGYTVRYGGQFEAQQSASRTIFLAGVFVVLAMVVLLEIVVGSFRVALLVLVNLPLALIGGVLAVFVAESPSVAGNLAALFGTGGYVAPVLSIASLVGFITLFGIAVRNGILLVNHYRHLTDEDGLPLREAIVQGSMERLVPILMTALTAALALAPIVLEGDRAGNEILAPLSVVILGGLLTSTFLNLIVVPAGYALIHSRKHQAT